MTVTTALIAISAAVAAACVIADDLPAAHAPIMPDTSKAVCYLGCPRGQWCARGTQVCRAPDVRANECFNLATGQFQIGCSPGFVCRGGKCDYVRSTEPNVQSPGE
ncbi:TPA: hypothetical protein N0F65_003251 [Lagenidium giganteum]|uniref:Uncharacterized protein n=1 Tax=Lagenidium giganteum TaxID=4803 RepID=A0AAV2YHB5_9STRA|nr:TPA: hypothetical protein N0F65_003251 [Lagenidium giganteum]